MRKSCIYNDLYGFIRNQDIHGDAYTHFYKGFACGIRGDHETTFEAKTAKNMGVDIIAAFQNDYANVADFEQKHNVKLPEDIAALLTPLQT